MTQVHQLIDNSSVYYYREYEHDFPACNEEKIPLWKRVGLIALPFLSFCDPLATPLSFVFGSLRSWSSVQQLTQEYQNGNISCLSLLQVIVSISALAGTLYAHRAGALITSFHDLFLKVINLMNHVRNRDNNQILQDVVEILNQSLYLALQLTGSLELSILSLVVQLIGEILKSKVEFQKHHMLEGTAHLVMALLRVRQLSGQVQALQTQYAFASLKKALASSQSVSIQGVSDVSLTEENIPLKQIADQLNDLVTENEKLAILQILSNKKKIDIRSTLLVFASVRGDARSFSSGAIENITYILQAYDPAWKGMDERFWNSLSQVSFSNMRVFSSETPCFNYEANHMIQTIQSLQKNSQLVTTSFVDALLARRCADLQKEDHEKWWRLACEVVHDQTHKQFIRENWKENFDISYQTAASRRAMEAIRGAAGWDTTRVKDADVIKVIDAFPKTMYFNLSNLGMSENGVLYVIQKAKYLTYFEASKCGGVRFDGEWDYYGVTRETINTLMRKEYLKFVAVDDDSSWGIDRLWESCCELKEIHLIDYNTTILRREDRS